MFFGSSALARVVDTIVCATTGSYCGEAFYDAVLGGTVDVTTGPYCGEACHDADLGGTVDVTTGPVLGVIDTMGVTTGSCSYRGEAFHDAVLGGTVDITTSPYCGEVCRDADLGGTVDVTTGPVLGVIDTVGITTGLCLAILHCDATMLFLEGDIVGETTNSLGWIMS